MAYTCSQDAMTSVTAYVELSVNPKPWGHATEPSTGHCDAQCRYNSVLLTLGFNANENWDEVDGSC